VFGDCNEGGKFQWSLVTDYQSLITNYFFHLFLAALQKVLNLANNLSQPTRNHIFYGLANS